MYYVMSFAAFVLACQRSYGKSRIMHNYVTAGPSSVAVVRSMASWTMARHANGSLAYGSGEVSRSWISVDL